MKKHDMRSLLGIMREFRKTQQVLIKEENEQIKTLSNEEIQNIQNLIINRIQEVNKFYYVEIENIKKEIDGLYINGKYVHDNKEYRINVIYKPNPNNSDITIEQPNNVITSGTEEETVADMVNSFHDIFINLQYDDQFKEYIK